VEVAATPAFLREGPAVRVAVRDAGVGLGEEQRRRLFEPFYTTKPGGLGLGLTLARGLAEMHGGMIDAQSDGPGRGSTFTFTLPLAALSAVER
jgi:signal transduction histidine kinase